MKHRILALFLAFSLLLSGCGFFGERIKEPVTFYYLCGSYQEDLCCVIVSEEREASGHAGNMPYLLALYMMGPANDELVMPLPSGARIASEMNGEQIILTLSNIAGPLSDIDFSLACACLTMTCLEITEAQSVTIRNGEQEKSMDRNTLTLYDTTGETLPMEEAS